MLYADKLGTYALTHFDTTTVQFDNSI